MIRQEDIARMLQISRTTVARALNGSESINPKTKEKVLKLCQEMGYIKNPISSSLATKKEKKIYALIVKSKNIYYTEQIIKGFKKAEEELKFYGFKINIIETDIDNPEEQLKIIKNLVKDPHISAIIITPLLKKEIKKEIEFYKSRIIFLTLDISIDKSILHIGPDYFKSGRIAADILSNILRKDEKVMVIDTNDDRISSKIYMEGFLSRINEEMLVGPIYLDNIKKEIRNVFNKNMSGDIKALYSSRFLTDIVDILYKEGNDNFIIVGNGMSKDMDKFIKDKKIVCSVVENFREEGYRAAIIIFEKLYKDTQIDDSNITIKSSIIFRENLIE